MRAGASAFSDSISPPPSPRGYMIISATIATSSRDAPASAHRPTMPAPPRYHDLANGGHGREVQHSREVVLAWVHGRHAAGRVQHDRPQCCIDREISSVVAAGPKVNTATGTSATAGIVRRKSIEAIA